jgi:hypothetical protein
VNKFKSSLSDDDSSYAKRAWIEMSKADECLWNSYQFKEIIVFEDFEVKNIIK